MQKETKRKVLLSKKVKECFVGFDVVFSSVSVALMLPCALNAVVLSETLWCLDFYFYSWCVLTYSLELFTTAGPLYVLQRFFLLILEELWKDPRLRVPFCRNNLLQLSSLVWSQLIHLGSLNQWLKAFGPISISRGAQ